jgi:hypothetical protein
VNDKIPKGYLKHIIFSTEELTFKENPMGDYYHIDLGEYSLQRFKNDLATREMIPSRVSLKDDLDTRFEKLETYGITNMNELINALNSKDKIERFSQETGLTRDYLTLLNREAKSYLPKPIRLDKFTGKPKKYLTRLEEIGIRNTRQLFDQVWNKKERESLAQKINIPIEILDELVCLSDLSRAYGIGPVFASMIYDVGIKTIKELVAYSAEDIIRIYEENSMKTADFGVNEIQFSLDLAKELEVSVEI